MEIYINIDGVLRNTIQKFDYHYKDNYLNSDVSLPKFIIDNDGNESEEIVIENFDYGVDEIIKNDDLFTHYRFQSIEEFKNFFYIDFAIEIFGHGGLSYPTAISDLNRLIHENKNDNITLIGIDNYGKSKPATLFFLSKNGCLANNIKFISKDDIDNLWKNCDIWITDDKKIIDACPENKIAIKFNTDYNKFFENKHELYIIEKIWENFLEKTTT